MNLKKYFETKLGFGVMATSDAGGVVDTAIYSKPHVLQTDQVAFVMRDRLTHSNLRENPHANYLFIEQAAGYMGIRLFLTKVEEKTDKELIAVMTRRHMSPEEDEAKGEKFLVVFKVDKVLSLIGSEEFLLG